MPMASAACVCPIAAVLTMPASAHIAMTARSKPFIHGMPSSDPPAPGGVVSDPGKRFGWLIRDVVSIPVIYIAMKRLSLPLA
jgi:hypothetical protein